MPPAAVDHINGVPSDNRWCNLLHATLARNQTNVKLRKGYTTGAKGVTQKGRSFTDYVTCGGRTVRLGTFVTISAASSARERATNELHGDWRGSRNGYNAADFCQSPLHYRT